LLKDALIAVVGLAAGAGGVTLEIILGQAAIRGIAGFF
jgi:hypothetical protein